VFFALIQSWKDERDKSRSILTDQINDPVIVPEVQRSFRHLPPHNNSKLQYHHLPYYTKYMDTYLAYSCPPTTFLKQSAKFGNE